MHTETVIALSKTKLVLLLVGALGFVAVGIWLLTLDAEFIASQRKFNNPSLVYGLGIVGIAFFGACGYIGIKKLFQQTPGLVLNAEGIFDNSSGVSAGLVPWSDISGIYEYAIGQQKFIAILVVDPDKYINRGNALRRMTNKANMKMSGTPINISANSLKLTYPELLAAITEYFQFYQVVTSEQR